MDRRKWRVEPTDPDVVLVGKVLELRQRKILADIVDKRYSETKMGRNVGGKTSIYSGYNT